MAIAIIASGVAMALMADTVADFLKENRKYRVPALFILFLVRVLLVTEGAHIAHLAIFGFAIDAMSKSSLYLIIFVLIVTDIISMNYQTVSGSRRRTSHLAADRRKPHARPQKDTSPVNGRCGQLT